MNCGSEIFFRLFHYWDNETKDLEDKKYEQFKEEFIKLTSLCNYEYNLLYCNNLKKDIYKLRLGMNHF
jgi:hypothetical protein